MEYIIENLSEKEREKLEASGTKVDWFPDWMDGCDICIGGTEADLDEVLRIIGRTK